MSEPDFKDVLFEQYNIRTDLALESHQVIVEQDLPPSARRKGSHRGRRRNYHHAHHC